MALSWLNLPCALKAAIVSESGHLATLATDRLPRSRGRGKARATAPSPRHLTRHRRERWGEGFGLIERPEPLTPLALRRGRLLPFGWRRGSLPASQIDDDVADRL